MSAVAEQIIKNADYWLDWNLENWARWMNSGGRPRGLPKSAAGGIENYKSLDAHNERAYELLDIDLAKRTNAVIEDLAPTERNVIYKEYGLISYVEIIHFDAVLTVARLKIMQGLRAKGVWLGE